MSKVRLFSKSNAYQSGVAVLAGATLLALPVAAGAADTVGVTEQVSVSGAEVPGNSSSQLPSISADGRYVAFASISDNLVAEDTNEFSDIFVRDRRTGATERVSVASNGNEGDADSGWLNLLGAPSISGDGRYVAFASDATNLVSQDRNNTADVFVHDRVTGETTRVSVTSDGSEASGRAPAISADGRYVGFVSDSTSLSPNSTGFRDHIFVHDRQTGLTERISQAPDGTAANANSFFAPHLSRNGDFVYFTSAASNLVPGGDAEGRDAFLFDRVNREMEAITSTGGDPSDFFGLNHGTAEGISTDGRFLTFTTDDAEFAGPEATDPFADAWLVDTQPDPNKLTLISVNDAGDQANEISAAGPVSDSGQFVLFESGAANLGGPERDSVYRRDLATNTTRLVSVAPDGGLFNSDTADSAMTPDGQVVAFNSVRDVFVRDMRPAADLVVSMTDAPDPVVERGQVTYTVTVDNLGPGAATGVRLVDTLPVDPTFVSAAASDGTCVRDVNSNSGGVLTCDLGTLESGESATVLVVVSPRRAEPITNTATVDATVPDPNTGNNTATETTTVQPR